MTRPLTLRPSTGTVTSRPEGGGPRADQRTRGDNLVFSRRRLATAGVVPALSTGTAVLVQEPLGALVHAQGTCSATYPVTSQWTGGFRPSVTATDGRLRRPLLRAPLGLGPPAASGASAPLAAEPLAPCGPFFRPAARQPVQRLRRGLRVPGRPLVPAHMPKSCSRRSSTCGTVLPGRPLDRSRAPGRPRTGSPRLRRRLGSPRPASGRQSEVPTWFLIIFQRPLATTDEQLRSTAMCHQRPQSLWASLSIDATIASGVPRAAVVSGRRNGHGRAPRRHVTPGLPTHHQLPIAASRRNGQRGHLVPGTVEYRSLL
jgi:hypothetical protein